MQEETNKELDDVIWKAATAAIILGIIVTAYLIIEQQKESYSALYLKPDSYQNYINTSTASFTYGITSYENKKTTYELTVYLGETKITEKQLTLNPGQTIEDMISFEIPKNISFPQKIQINMTANKQNYSVHYWLKGRK